jgi:UDPglucose 6-dehydrogenase
MDRRIGAKFLHAGPGFGGSCFPKDTMALSIIGQQYSSPTKIVDAVIDVNRQQRLSMIPKIESLADGLEGKRVAVLGLAFKPETDDMRDAPSVEIIQGLLSRGAKVIAYDPVAREEAEKILPQIEYAADEYEAADGADVLVFVTEWNQFRALNMDRIRTSMRAARVADLRNIYDPTDMREMGFEYVGVGR